MRVPAVKMRDASDVSVSFCARTFGPGKVHPKSHCSWLNLRLNIHSSENVCKAIESRRSGVNFKPFWECLTPGVGIETVE